MAGVLYFSQKGKSRATLASQIDYKFIATLLDIYSEEESMMVRFKAGYIQDMVLLVNKPPKWNESVRAVQVALH